MSRSSSIRRSRSCSKNDERRVCRALRPNRVNACHLDERTLGASRPNDQRQSTYPFYPFRGVPVAPWRVVRERSLRPRQAHLLHLRLAHLNDA